MKGAHTNRLSALAIYQTCLTDLRRQILQRVRPRAEPFEGLCDKWFKFGINRDNLLPIWTWHIEIAYRCKRRRERVAKDLGVGKSMLGKWVSQYRPTDMVSAPQADLARENERIRLENRVLKEERDILKKATQFFASQRP